jgi:hypothetical protein
LAGNPAKGSKEDKGGFNEHPQMKALEEKYLLEKEELCQALLTQHSLVASEPTPEGAKAEKLAALEEKIEKVLKVQDEISKKLTNKHSLPSDTEAALSVKSAEEPTSSDSEFGLSEDEVKHYQLRDFYLEKSVEYQSKEERADEVTKKVLQRKEDRKRKREEEVAANLKEEAEAKEEADSKQKKAAEEAADKEKKYQVLLEKEKSHEKELKSLKDQLAKQVDKIKKLKEKDKERELFLTPKAAAKGGRKSGPTK